MNDFMMRIKDQNELYQVLVNVLNEKPERGFLRLRIKGKIVGQPKVGTDESR